MNTEELKTFIFLSKVKNFTLAAEQLFKDGAAVTPESLLPVYLRLPQAERELKKKQEENVK